MNLKAILIGLLLVSFGFIVIWHTAFELEADMDSPIKLDQQEYAEDFGRWVSTLPSDQQQTMASYIERWDAGELRASEPDWSQTEVSPRSILEANIQSQ